VRKLTINIVWIKRDLRTLDHESFHAAESKNIPYLPVYIFDNDLIDYPDTSDRHLGFIYNSLIDINKKLIVYNLKDENFISSFLSKNIKTENYKEITFFKIADSKDVLDEFRSIYLKSENECLKSFARTINNSDLQINQIANTEIALREFVLGNSKNLNRIEFNNAEKLKNVIEMIKILIIII